jgi:hypothetical protein
MKPNKEDLLKKINGMTSVSSKGKEVKELVETLIGNTSQNPRGGL